MFESLIESAVQLFGLGLLGAIFGAGFAFAWHVIKRREEK